MNTDNEVYIDDQGRTVHVVNPYRAKALNLAETFGVDMDRDDLEGLAQHLADADTDRASSDPKQSSQ